MCKHGAIDRVGTPGSWLVHRVSGWQQSAFLFHFGSLVASKTRLNHQFLKLCGHTNSMAGPMRTTDAQNLACEQRASNVGLLNGLSSGLLYGSCGKT
jgi:hypothetical protein